jgi:ABC-type antimicrobial peptide transport system permease subunit
MVAQRVTEIGVRVALGASPADIFGRVLGRTLRLVVPATAGGLLGALILSHLLAGLLFGVGTRDLFTYVAAPVLLVAVAMAAAYVPAWRAASLDPMVALRDG